MKSLILSRSLFRSVGLPALLAAASLSPGLLRAEEAFWQTAGSGLWSAPANWDAIPDGVTWTARVEIVDITTDATISLDSPRSLNSLWFADVDVNTPANWILDDNGSPANTLTLGGTSPVIDVSFMGTNTAAIISATIAGTSGFTKTGTETLVLSGVNTYAGNLRLAEGTVRLSGGDNRLPVTSGLQLAGTATLNLGGTTQTVGNVASFGVWSGTASLSSGVLVATGGATRITFGTTNAGVSTFQTFDLSGLTSFQFEQPLKSLFVDPTQGGAAAQTNVLLLPDSTTLSISNLLVAPTGGAGSTVNNGTLSLGSNNVINTDFASVGSTRSIGTLNFRNAGSALTLRGSTGGTSRVVQMVVGVNAAGSSAGVLGFGNFSGGTVDAMIDSLIIAQQSSVSTDPTSLGTVIFNGGTLDVNRLVLGQQANGGRSGVGNGIQPVFTQSNGTVLAGSVIFGDTRNTNLPRYTAVYNLAGGTLDTTFIGCGTNVATNGFASTSTRTFNWSGGTFQNGTITNDLLITGTNYLGTNANNGGRLTVNLLGTNQLTLNVATGKTVVIAPSVTVGGTNGLTKSGDGLLTTAATNTYSGATIISGGQIVDAGGRFLASSYYPVDVNTAERYVTAATVSNVAIGALDGTRNVSLTNSIGGNVSFTVGSTSNGVLTGNLTGITGLSKQGAGTQTLAGTNSLSLSRIQVRGGTLVITNGTYLITTGAGTGFSTDQNGFTVAGGRFQMDGGTINFNTMTWAFPAGNTPSAASHFVQNGGFFNAANVAEILMAYGVNNCTFTLNGGTFRSSSFKLSQGGSTVVNLVGGAFEANRLFAAGSGIALNLNGGTVRARMSTNAFIQVSSIITANVSTNGLKFDSTNFNVTIGQPLLHHATLGATNDGGVVKLGSGTLVLSAATNTYNGPTTVSNGTLEVNGWNADSSLTRVEVAGVLAGTGTVGVTEVSGAIAPAGTNVGLLTVGSVTFDTGSVLQVQYDGITNDVLAASAATFTGPWTLAAGTNLPSGIYTVLTTVSGVTNFVAPTVTGSSGSAALVGNDVVLTVTAVSLTPFETWQTNYFGTTTNANAAYDQDPDGDGVNNLLEYAFATSPISGASVALPQTGTSGDYLTITVPRNSNATDISYLVQGSSNLLEWATNTVLTATNPAPAGSTVTYTNGTTFSSQPTQFLRVKVTQP